MPVFLRAVFLLFLAGVAVPGAWGQTTLEGRVVDRQGKPIPGAEVVLKRTAGELRQQTNEEGIFRFLGASAGEYELVVTAEGYFGAEKEIAIRPRQPVLVQVELAARTGPPEKVEVKAADVSLGEAVPSRLLTHAELASLPELLRRDLPTLALAVFPGATLSHDNFVHVRGNEISLQESVNGVSFLENPQQQFNPGMSPDMFETVSMVSGSFAAEYGNRFGGILDITTRSGHDLKGHGSFSAGGGMFQTTQGSAEYGARAGRFGTYVFANGFSSDWYLNPPEPVQRHDFGFGGRGAAQLDYRGVSNTLGLFVTGGGANFQLPNLADDQKEGRDTSRRLRSETAIFTWQHIFSPAALATTAVYERTLEDRLTPTSDLVTPFGDGRRSSFTAGLKGDFIFSQKRNVWKAGLDLTRLRLKERFAFDSREVPLPPEDPPAFAFVDRIHGGQASFYVQDHILITPNLSAELGLRFDFFDLTRRDTQASPRAGLSYHIPLSRTTVHASYNRFFSPYPIEYLLLAKRFGTAAPNPLDRVGEVRPYRQHSFEAGVGQELHPKLAFEVTGFYHRGSNPFEYREISITRLFLPINSSRVLSYGVETGVTLKQLERLGLSARLQYAYQRTFFYGPISGGFAVGESKLPGERFLPAFDEPHSGTVSIFYHRRWRDLNAGAIARYGSGTAAGDGAVRLPSHGTLDLSAGLNLLERESYRLALHAGLQNLSDNRYPIAKESEETPIQFAPPRLFSATVKVHF